MRSHSQLDTINPIPQVTLMAAVQERAKTEHAKDVKERRSICQCAGEFKKTKEAAFCHSFQKGEDVNITEEEENLCFK